MAKVTTVTTSYTSDIVVNGTAIPADKIYANGTQIRRCIVNGIDVLHKFTRTVVTASSNLTFNFQVVFNASADSWHRFYSPINVAVTITDNGSSGFTYVVANTTVTFYCSEGDEGSYPNRYYQQSLSNQVFTIGQTTYLKFNYFEDKYIYKESISREQNPRYTLDMYVTDPDGVSTTLSIGADYDYEPYYSRTTTSQRTINKTLSDNTVQEY